MTIVIICFGLGGNALRKITAAEQAHLLTVHDLAAHGVAVGTPSEEGNRYQVREYANGITETVRTQSAGRISPFDRRWEKFVLLDCGLLSRTIK